MSSVNENPAVVFVTAAELSALVAAAAAAAVPAGTLAVDTGARTVGIVLPVGPTTFALAGLGGEWRYSHVPAALAGQSGRLLTPVGTEPALAVSVADAPAGLLLDTATIGGQLYARVQTGPQPVPVIAGAPIAALAPFTTDAAGAAVPAVPGNNIWGYASTAALNPGDTFLGVYAPGTI